jgi:hypothetical protein
VLDLFIEDSFLEEFKSSVCIENFSPFVAVISREYHLKMRERGAHGIFSLPQDTI